MEKSRTKNMKQKIRQTFILLLGMLGSLPLLRAQYLEERRYPAPDQKGVREYYYKAKEGYSRMKHLFRDSVSVAEMKAAFYAHRNDTADAPSPYAGKDSVTGVGEYLMPESPLQKCPVKEARELRGRWLYYGPFKLVGLTDSDGTPREDILERLTKKYPNLYDWFEGDVILLREPVRYMGYIVSPHPMMLTYKEQYGLLHNASYGGPIDYFATIYPLGYTLPEKAKISAYFLGQALNEKLPPILDNRIKTPHTFSVLLYAKEQGYYDLELLLPETPDSETLELFQQMQSFVRRLQRDLFKPYYTTDRRLLTGRFYRVERTPHGWYVEDYLKQEPR